MMKTLNRIDIRSTEMRILLNLGIFVVFPCLSLILSSQFIFQSSFAQDPTEFRTYDSINLGIRLSYPSNWYVGTPGNDYNCSDVCHETWQIIDGPDAPFPDATLVIEKYNITGSTILEKCKCKSLNEFGRYNTQSSFSNETIIGKMYPALQVEYPKNKLKIFTQVNKTFYEISYFPLDERFYSKRLPQVKKMIDSVEFLPVEIQKKIEKIPETELSNRTLEKIKNFLRYEDPIGGFKISYPSHWNITMKSGNAVEITTPAERFSDIYDTNAMLGIYPHHLPSMTKSLENVTNYKLGLKNPFFTETLLESNSTSIAGLPAYEVAKELRSVSDLGMGLNQKALEIWTVHDDKWYDVLYISPTAKYDNYLPIVLSMIKTLEIS